MGNTEDFIPRSAAEVGGGGASELKRLERENAQLRQAMASRPVIDQARGMIMALGSCGPGEAWEVLREVSQSSNIKLRLVAVHLVATATGHRPPEVIRRALARSLHVRKLGKE
ncbi:ANTAR domain-containing protein [Streptomyces sp. NPDC057363]|uniref:ANTAR domain-containing protein n=1 Tax=Streptomyces sp. NPDC057363 TaxID=3346107 RepID=UPI0036431703